MLQPFSHTSIILPLVRLCQDGCNTSVRLAFLKHLYFAHIIGWTRDIGCSDDHKLIADYLDFLDPDVQVCSHKLRLNTVYY